jgi:hypothetical protein
MSRETIKPGDKVKATAEAFSGFVVERQRFLHGSDRFLVKSENGRETRWFHGHELELIEAAP